MYTANKYWHLLLALFISVQASAQSVNPLEDNTTQKPKSSGQTGLVQGEFVLQKEQMEERKKDLVKKLKDLKVNDFKNYIEEMYLLRDSVQLFIENKKKECLGEFASIVMNDAGESELVKRKLTKEEKKLCLHDLKTFNAFYIGRLFDSKKEYLRKIYQRQMSAMEVAKDDLLEEMEKRFKQIELQQTGRRSSRRRFRR